MGQLKTIDGISITEYLLAIPETDAIKVENRLLDGSFHVQVIGSGAKVLNCRVAIREDGKNLIDQYEAEGILVRAESRGLYWVGLIRKKPEWKWVGSDLYEGEFQLLVREEGTT